ncbi:hypothetical protein [Amycolatopsis suaedae]|uniref:Uncharacterized protein n=1 Tax=Amycolatopsis suaedae TaxID=2510978 RepID=A0A4Q7IXN6_9PSEU|nr:hypothetical protein [Amycolatopsis suaedae]RZQ59711.1 hypothetical protein EWH70_33350 [Amycolatopsis suaedae]
MNTLSIAAAAVSFSAALVTVLLGGLFESRRRAADRAAEKRHRVNRYRDPLLQATASLHGRLANALGGIDFKLEDIPRHARVADYDSLYRFANYLGWVEILFREVHFLDLGSRRANTRLIERLGDMHGALNKPIADDQLFRLFAMEQRALGELMMADPVEGEDRRRCIGYVEFCRRLDGDPEYRRWFQPLLDDIGTYLAHRGGPGQYRPGELRLIMAHNALLELMRVLDRRAIWNFVTKDHKLLPVEDAVERHTRHHGRPPFGQAAG